MRLQKKYKQETLDNLAEIYNDSEFESPSDKLSKLYEIVNISCYDKMQFDLRDMKHLHKVKDSHEQALNLLNKLYIQIRADIEQFKTLPIEDKLNSITKSKLMEVSPKRYRHNENIFLMDEYSTDVEHDYLTLTAPLRREFKKRYDAQIIELQKIITQANATLNERGNHE
ncbi:hypothetical protein [Pseudomonas sp. NY8896]|uniref:hypothetical protein n=2 Tax=unclassified Pseudomonas TaxID=196821 RepID=UPI0031F6EA95